MKKTHICMHWKSEEESIIPLTEIHLQKLYREGAFVYTIKTANATDEITKDQYEHITDLLDIEDI